MRLFTRPWSNPPFPMERKRPWEGTRRSGSTSRRISVFALLETLLNCGLWITLSTQERQHKLQQLRSAHIHPTCSQGNKGEVNSPIRGPAPIKINKSDSGHRRRLLLSHWLLRDEQQWVFTMLSSQILASSFPLGREGRNLLLPPLPSPLSRLARCTGDLR